MRILIMGLPGSGKTTLAERLLADLSAEGLQAKWYNADDVRAAENDWDFGEEGRQRQAKRMRTLADDSAAYGFKYVICDFVCPTQKLRNIFEPDLIIWMDTIASSRFADTNRVFELPSKYDYRITEFDGYPWTKVITENLKNYENKV
jgi:GTPase SAR1 family protein